MIRTVVVAAALAATLILAFLGYRQAITPSVIIAYAVDTAGTEQPEEGALYINGFNIPNLPGIPLRDFFERNESLLGEPLTSFDGQAQTYRFGRVTYTRSNPPEWQLQIDNLGSRDMELEGYTPQSGESAHLAVRDYLLEQQDLGIDVPRVYGPVISPAICKKGQCTQWTEKQRLMFPDKAITGEQVRRGEVGLWAVHPRTHPTEVAVDTGSNAWLNPFSVGAGLALVITLIVFALSRRGSHMGGPLG